MKNSRRDRLWTFAGLFLLVLGAGAVSRRTLERRPAPAVLDDGLRDAVASAPPATAGLAGRPVPTIWFKTPAQSRAEIDAALLSSRRRRALARRVAVQ